LVFLFAQLIVAAGSQGIWSRPNFPGL
jgi:hypothetical protein